MFERGHTRVCVDYHVLLDTSTCLLWITCKKVHANVFTGKDLDQQQFYPE